LKKLRGFGVEEERFERQRRRVHDSTCHLDGKLIQFSIESGLDHFWCVDAIGPSNVFVTWDIVVSVENSDRNEIRVRS
jgi:hypothetical protein